VKISQAPAPFHVIARGWAGANLWAMILFEKFGQHQPSNRQAERYALEGVPISLSFMARVAEMMGEDEEWPWDVATEMEMEQEDSLIWIYGPSHDSVMAFTDFGIETLTGIVEIHKTYPCLLKRATDPD
jgi:Transposase IS66 family